MPGDAKRGLKPPVYVDTEAALSRLADSLRNQSWIAVDTESNPLFAYHEKLCLIQISTKTRDYIIDPLAGVDLSVLVPVFADPMIVKIFHDAEFDVLMLRRTLPLQILGIFDTKVVAMALGAEAVGLAAILKDSFGVTLDKKYQRSDWGMRPLTEGQLDYARHDTHFLIPLAEDLRSRLYESDEIMQLEVAAEFQRLEQLTPEAKVFNPDDFTKIKGWERLDPARRRILRELYVARHGIADRSDRPAFKVLSSDTLLKLARSQPADIAVLKRERLLTPKLCERYGDIVLEAIARGRRLAPLPDGRINRTKKPVEQLSEEQRGTYENLRGWRKRTAVGRGADASLILPRTMMLALSQIRNRPTDIDELRNCGILEPWRVDYYGEGILTALRGSRNADRGGGRTRKAGRKRSAKRKKAHNRAGNPNPHLG
ncbi:MAG: HRDC domain-containing protein [Planctomycetota bacterium]|nr:HRDC domain-containing protein [Planctomycetota bacterium]